MVLADTVLVTSEGVEMLTKAPKDGLQYDLEDKEEVGSVKAEKLEDGKQKKRKGIEKMTFFLWLVEVEGKRKSRMRDATAVTNELELKERQKVAHFFCDCFFV